MSTQVVEIYEGKLKRFCRQMHALTLSEEAIMIWFSHWLMAFPKIECKALNTHQTPGSDNIGRPRQFAMQFCHKARHMVAVTKAHLGS